MSRYGSAAAAVAISLSLLGAALFAQSAAAAFEPVSQFGTGIPGGTAGQLTTPYDVAVDTDGTVYVAEPLNHRISVFAPDGSFLRTFGKDVAIAGGTGFELCTAGCKQGSAGADAGEMNAPFGIALDGAGNVYVADNFNSRINVYTTAGAFVRTFGWDVNAAGGSGLFENCTVSPCQTGAPGDGAGQFNFPQGVAVDGGLIYVGDINNRISVITTGGVFQFAFGKDVDPPSGGGPEICAATCQVGVGDGTSGALNAPIGVAVGAGKVYVADQNNLRIAVFTTAGGFERAFGKGVNGGTGFEAFTASCQTGSAGGLAGELGSPSSIALAGGSLIVSDVVAQRISVYTTAGGFERAFGKDVDPAGGGGFEVCTASCQAGTIGAAPGEFSSPEGVSVDSAGAVYVADRGNDRVQKLAEVPSPPAPEPPDGVSPPSNDFSLGSVKLNKKKGTAEIAVQVPGAGQLVLGGDKLKGATVQADGAGEEKLTIRASGKAKHKLSAAGAVKLSVEITYTPSGGSANAKTTEVKLKKKS